MPWLVRAGGMALVRIEPEKGEDALVDIAAEEESDQQQQHRAKRRVVVVRAAAQELELRLWLVQAIEGRGRPRVARPLAPTVDVPGALRPRRRGGVGEGLGKGRRRRGELGCRRKGMGRGEPGWRREGMRCVAEQSHLEQADVVEAERQGEPNVVCGIHEQRR